MLVACGPIKEWKRFLSASGEAKDGGIVEFKDTQGVFTCLKFIDGLTISQESSPMIAKTNQKMMGLISDIRDSKRKEYLDFIS